MIEQKVENATQQDFSLAGCLKQVEKTGRISYKSESKITDDSYKAFTEMLKKNKHLSPFGHGTLILDVVSMQDTNPVLYARITNSLTPYYNRYVRCEDFLIISARILAELPVRYVYFDNVNFFNDVYPYIVTDEDTLKFLFDKWPQNRRLTVKCTTSISMTRELNRHFWSLDISGDDIQLDLPEKALDINERSTRYVKVNEWIKPYFWNGLTQVQQNMYEKYMNNSFKEYQDLLDAGFTKQQARGKLPLDTLTEVYYTAFDFQWKEVYAKRTAKGVHPQMIDLMNKIREALQWISF